MTIPLNIVAISGSLRRDSLNTNLLRALQDIAPESLRITLHSLEGLPLYNEELEDGGAPPSVVALRAAVTAADGLIFASPEYNRSMSGVLKNALDWLSRPAHDGAAKGKNCIALVATESTYHGMGAWVDLAQLLRHMNNHVVEPDLVLHSAHVGLARDPAGAIRILDEWFAAAATVQLASLEAAIRGRIGDQILEAYDKFADQQYRPRRAAMEYPLKLKTLEVEPAGGSR